MGHVPEGRLGSSAGFSSCISTLLGFVFLHLALGLVRPEMGDSLTNTLEVLAKSGKDPEILNLPLIFADGWMTLGPLPLGPAPVMN